VARKSETAQYLDRLKNDAVKARGAFDADWWLNVAFYLNHQYTRWGRGNVLEAVPRDDGDTAVRPVANKILHFVMQSHAAAMSNDMQPEVRATTADSADLSQARVTQAYLDELIGPSQIAWDTVRAEGLLWAVSAGTGWFKWFYNAAKGRPDVIAVSPFDVAIDPYVKSYKDARYIIHTQFMDTEQVYDEYNVKPKNEGAERIDSLKATVLSAMGYAPALTGVSINELWMRPTRRFPEGRYAVWTDGGQVIVDPGPTPYKHLRLPQSTGLPFTQIGMVPVPGVPYYHSVVKTARPLQMELNDFHKQTLIARKAFANPKWFIDAAMFASMEKGPTDAPNEVLIGDTLSGQLPIPAILQPAAMADDGSGDWIVSEMQDAFGLHEVSQGGAPGRVDSAKALELLRNEDLSRLTVLNKTTGASTSDGFWQLLMLAKQYVPLAKLATTYTRDGLPEVRKFMAAKLSDDTRVRVIPSTTMPKTQASRNEFLISLWQAGIISDPRRMSELLELPYSGSAADTERDARKAMNENILMSSGVPLTPDEWDDHQRHIAEHNNERKTAEFAAASDEVHNIYQFHVDEHKALEQAEAATFAAEQKALTEIGQNAAPDPPPDLTDAPPVDNPVPPVPPDAAQAPAPSAGAPTVP
jgi:hypothetical protein